MPPKKRMFTTRSSMIAKHCRQNTAQLAAVLSEAIEVPASNALGSRTMSLPLPHTTPSNNNPVSSGSLNISFLATTIRASLIQGLQAVGISAIPSFSSKRASNSTQVTAVTNSEVESITSLSGVTISTSLDGHKPATFCQGGTFCSIAISLGCLPDKLKQNLG